MQLSDLMSLLCGIGVIAILIGMYFSQRATKNNILKYLTALGATDIQIEHNLFDSDRDTMTFYIRYTGVRGNRQSVICKARYGIFDAGGLFWSDLPELNPLGGEAAPAVLAPPIATDSSNNLNQLFFSEKMRTRSTTELPTYQVVKMLPILGSKDQIVLLDGSQPFQNLLRCHAEGEIVWQAELHSETNDAYTDVEWREGELTAINKAGVTVTLNLKTGKIL